MDRPPRQSRNPGKDQIIHKDEEDQKATRHKKVQTMQRGCSRTRKTGLNTTRTLVNEDYDDKPSKQKRFWSEKTGISPLKNKGRHLNAPKYKANILNRQYQSTFTQEDTNQVRSPSGIPYPKMFCLFDLILNVPSTIFQLYRDGSSWVEPVLS